MQKHHFCHGLLRGAKLEVRSGTNVITGRLISVEHKTRMGAGATLEVDYVALLTDSGEVKTTEVSPSFSVHLLEKGLTGKVDRFLDLLSSTRDADVRRMTISTQGTGDRSLFVSYISEVPVWKATYRIVLRDKASPLLQGWAIVDNTVGQDWENVQLSLVAGAPQSFIQNLSQPYYTRRPVVALSGSMNAMPQTYQSTLIAGSARIGGIVTDPAGGVVAGARIRALDAGRTVVAEATADAGGQYELAVPGGSYRVEFQSPGFQQIIAQVNIADGGAERRNVRLNVGSVSESVEVTAEASAIDTESASLASRGRNLGSGNALGQQRQPRAPGPPAPPASMIADARSQMQTAASAQELGDLFEYKIKEPITIRKNRSALVPIVQSSIGAEKVSIWNEQARLPRPQRALWLTNSSGLTLDGGSFSVLEEETFAGEGLFDPIRPDEKRLVSFASDLALNVSAQQGSEAQSVTHVTVSHGVMVQQSEVREKKTYTFRNEDTTPRTVIVEHPARNAYELRSDVKPAETTAGWMRFRVNVPSKQTASLVVEEARPTSTRYALTNLDSNQLALFIRQKSIDKTVEGALRKIVAQKAVVAEAESKSSTLEDESSKIFDDQQRLRENLKALKGSAEEKALLQRYTRQLNDQEDRLDTLKKETAKLDTDLAAAKAALNRMIDDLSLDVRL